MSVLQNNVDNKCNLATIFEQKQVKTAIPSFKDKIKLQVTVQANCTH